MLEDKFVVINDAKIHYIEDGNGTPFIFCHGARFNSRTYEETDTIQTVVDSGFHAISLDFPGYGKSENLSIDMYTFLANFVDILHLPPVVILGASMGGEAVTGFATKYPDKVKGLVLVGAVGVSEFESNLSKLEGKPMLLLWGKSDAISAPDNYELLMRYNSVAQFYNIGRQHACYLDDPKGFNEKIKEFLAKLK
ncbi:alpha/beta hydrolase [Ferroplasma sp.]|uniref:alpha/beta fold hydrolase n=1 Tax=Ferroplasma sp. TaxID=2591003 RepID=UPI00307E7C4D